MREKKKWIKKNPYKYQLQIARKAANKKRQEEIKATKQSLQGDPVWGVKTPWIESLDSGGQSEFSTPKTDDDGNPLEEPHELPTSKHLMNYGLYRNDFESAIRNAYELTRPYVTPDRSQAEPVVEQEMARRHAEQHKKRQEAVARIVALENGNARNRLSANVRRIVETFGRHETDKVLPARPKSVIAPPHESTPRAGPDTGSSEVQIGILTAKIRALAKELETTGHSDKHNKRNLRLLVHRRQKLLKYMFRKEKGSARWTHMIEKLGITDPCWTREITM
ncbi:putative ribosomal protein s15 protein [Zalerion maritima]|uniref:Ribosomal protein s15 protein n=1 Tax=Zalerion maritima TaxID=339359 RepID=A0AAD5RWZ0_9PEZI|nr:putative ribosomal protein s15 protein [Zalerion maritima]